MESPGRVAIVGAGFAGLALGCALVRAGRPVTVIERRPELPRSGAAVAIQPNGLAALDALGVLDAALEAGSRIERLLLRDRRGRLVAVFDYRELDHPHPFMLEIRRFDLLRTLARELSARGGQDSLSFGAPLTELVREDGAVCGLRYGTGKELATVCVAGADGIGSAVREQLEITVKTQGEAPRYVVGIGGRPDGLADGEAWIHHGKGYANGVMPFGARSYFYDSVTAANLAAVDAGDLNGWSAVYAERVPAGPQITAALEDWDELSVLTGRPQCARRRTADGAVLLGDAAASVHPHAAQGANLALEDGVALGELLAGFDAGRRITQADLEPYERERGRKAARYVAWSRLAGRSFDGETAVWRAQRWLGWQGTRLGPVRRELLRRGAGLRS